jgi:hypothetical protein
MEKEKNSKKEIAIENLIKLEDIAAKKTKIHSRLFINPSLAKSMEELSLRHENRMQTLLKIAQGKEVDFENDGGMVASNAQKEQE